MVTNKDKTVLKKLHTVSKFAYETAVWQVKIFKNNLDNKVKEQQCVLF